MRGLWGGVARNVAIFCHHGNIPAALTAAPDNILVAVTPTLTLLHQALSPSVLLHTPFLKRPTFLPILPPPLFHLSLHGLFPFVQRSLTTAVRLLPLLALLGPIHLPAGVLEVASAPRQLVLSAFLFTLKARGRLDGVGWKDWM